MGPDWDQSGIGLGSEWDRSGIGVGLECHANDCITKVAVTAGVRVAVTGGAHYS